VLAIDRDPQAIAAGAQRFANEVRLALVHASFADLAALVPIHAHGKPCHGVLFDLGVSSPQLDDRSGDSASAPMVRSTCAWTRHVASRSQPGSLGGPRRDCEVIAHSVKNASRGACTSNRRTRREHPIARTSQLAAIVAKAVRTREPGKHPATVRSGSAHVHQR